VTRSRMTAGGRCLLPALVLLAACAPPDAPAGEAAPPAATRLAAVSARPPLPPAPPAPAPPAAEAPLRIEISLADRRLWLLEGEDTLLSVPAGIGKGTTLRHEGRSWTFDTPRGTRTVLGKQRDPVWVPPDWHFVEAARERAFELAAVERERPVELSGGTRLEVRGRDVGIAYPDSTFEPLPPGEEIVFDGVLYVPPLGTRQRRVEGELGTHKLDLGDGYLIHGTREGSESSVGAASSHGCIRLRNADVERLFREVPVGTRVLVR
jgi:lipoprotein-anchoring transpeptidase ErfK/SrfK